MSSEIRKQRKIKKNPGSCRGEGMRSHLVDVAESMGLLHFVRNDLFVLGVLLLANVLSAQPSDLTFKMEFSKSEIYVGEQVFCNFVVYTPDEIVNVEVEKFSDFRGFWKDNLILRQGPIPTAITGDGSMRKTIIGSYLITPMLGDIEPIIDPMRIVIRDTSAQVDGSADQKRAVSEGPRLTIKKLPPIGSKEWAKFFHGAVGNLTLAAEKPIVNFKKDEPFILRFALAGEGNFPDINDLNLLLPPKVEVLSKRSTTQGSGQYFTKVFEYTLAAHKDENLLIDPLQFLYFNPLSKKYSLLETAPVHLQKEMSDESLAASNEELPLMPIETTFHVSTPWKSNKIFFAINFALLLVFFSVAAAGIVRGQLKERERNPKYQRKLKWKQASKELDSGSVEGFLRIADQLAFEILADKISVSQTSVTRTQLLEIAKARVPAELWLNAKVLFAAHNDFLFGPRKELPQEPSSLNRSLSVVMES
jgi:hypothetical protein